MGIEDKNNPNDKPRLDIADELNLTHVHKAVKRIFDDLEIAPDEEFVETGDTGLGGPTIPEDTTPMTRLGELREELENLREEHRRTADRSLLRRMDKIQEEIFLREKDNNPGKPLNDAP